MSRTKRRPFLSVRPWSARTGRMKKSKHIERQETAILDKRLDQLSGLERKKLEDGYIEVIKRI